MSLEVRPGSNAPGTAPERLRRWTPKSARRMKRLPDASPAAACNQTARRSQSLARQLAMVTTKAAAKRFQLRRAVQAACAVRLAVDAPANSRQVYPARRSGAVVGALDPGASTRRHVGFRSRGGTPGSGARHRPERYAPQCAATPDRAATLTPRCDSRACTRPRVSCAAAARTTRAGRRAAPAARGRRAVRTDRAGRSA